MDDDAKQQTLLSALVTEHFVFQSARGVATSEAGTRVSLFLTSLTGRWSPSALSPRSASSLTLRRRRAADAVPPR
jgi:hypothetical protein